MSIIYDDSTAHLLLPDSPASRFGEVGAMPRRTRYGSAEAEALGLVAADDEVEPVPEVDWKEYIADCHAKQLFPMHHRANATALEQKPTQNGLNYCWGWSIRACLENARLRAGQPPLSLAPTSLGWLVGWRNKGFYLDETIKGVRDRGIASAEYVPDQHSIDPSTFKEGWEADALKNRCLEWWDTSRQRGVKHYIGQILRILSTGTPGYQAHNWEGHAMCLFGLEWDESKKHNLVFVEFNSHRDGIRRLSGDVAIPDEFYGMRLATLR